MHDEKLRSLARKAARAELRIRASAAIRALALALPFVGVYALAALTWIKLAHPPVHTEHALTLGAAGLLALAFLVAAVVFLRRRPPRFGAQALDRHHALSDRITNALAFDAVPKSQRTPLMEAAISDALAVATDVRPARAAPLRLPRELLVSVGIGLALAGVSRLEVRRMETVIVETPTFQPMALNAEDAELLREVAEHLASETTDPEVRAAVQRFNQLVEDIAERRVERRDVFRRLSAMESALLDGLQADSEALDEGLRGIARELDRSGLTKPVAEALNDKRLDDAEKALRELAEKLKQKRDKVSKQELENLRKALETASKASAGRLDRIAAKRAELEEQKRRLLKKKQPDKPLSAKDQQELKQNENQLQRLQRNQHKAELAKKKMSELDRELAKAAQELMKELGDSARHLEAGAESLNRTAREEMSNEEKRALKRRLEEMRELLRQQGKGGKERAQRMLNFGRKARGGKPGDSGKSGKKGKGQGAKKGSPQIMIGPGGGGIPLDMPGAGPSGATAANPGQDGAGPGEGQEWGSGSGGEVAGDKTDLKGSVQDVSAAGIDSGQGVSASEVVYGAAERGFVGRGYQKVYTDYQTVAEEVLNRDEIPPGYQFYVRRYFQLIRPRE